MAHYIPIVTYKSISNRISLKKSQKETQCRYTGDPIQKEEIAFVVSSKDNIIRDRFIKLSNLRKFLSHLEHIYNNQLQYESSHDISDSIPYWKIKYEEKHQAYHTTCAYCEGLVIGDPVVSFSVQQDDVEPAIHVSCILSLIENTEEVLQNMKDEIVAQMI